jgi:hypothetical protein
MVLGSVEGGCGKLKTMKYEVKYAVLTPFYPLLVANYPPYRTA